ncbi:MAG: hypothetical protein M3Y08_06325 [Fibrobacterota bacterium]|nr:hypothetical protein [Fibrobacterota bacterium]
MLGFTFVSVIGVVITKIIWIKFLYGAGVGLTLFIAHWRWMQGINFGIFRGGRLEPTGAEEFDEAIRPLKEKGGLPEEPDEMIHPAYEAGIPGRST